MIVVFGTALYILKQNSLWTVWVSRRIAPLWLSNLETEKVIECRWSERFSYNGVWGRTDLLQKSKPPPKWTRGYQTAVNGALKQTDGQYTSAYNVASEENTTIFTVVADLDFWWLAKGCLLRCVTFSASSNRCWLVMQETLKNKHPATTAGKQHMLVMAALCSGKCFCVFLWGYNMKSSLNMHTSTC